MVSGTQEVLACLPPDWSRDEDFAARLSALPPGASAKGMFFQAVVDTLKRDLAPAEALPKHVRFKDYPLADFIPLAEQAVHRLWPRVSSREGLRRLGQQVYPMFADTMVGSAIFSIAARDWPSTLRLSSKAYGISIKPGSATIEMRGEREALVMLRDVWSFPSSYQIGIFEGAMRLLDVRGEVLLRTYSMCNADLLIRW